MKKSEKTKEKRVTFADEIQESLEKKEQIGSSLLFSNGVFSCPISFSSSELTSLREEIKTYIMNHDHRSETMVDNDSICFNYCEDMLEKVLISKAKTLELLASVGVDVFSSCLCLKYMIIPNHLKDHELDLFILRCLVDKARLKRKPLCLLFYSFRQKVFFLENANMFVNYNDVFFMF